MVPLLRLADAQAAFQMVRHLTIINGSIDQKHPDGSPERLAGRDVEEYAGLERAKSQGYRKDQLGSPGESFKN